MQVVGARISWAVLILLSLLGGGLPSTTGVTPLPEDPVVAQIAPTKCLFYSSWTGKTEASPDGISSTEQLFSDAEFVAYVGRIDQRIHDLFAQHIGKSEANHALRILKHLQSHAGAFYISEITGGRDRIPSFRGGLVLRVDHDDIRPIVRAVESLLERVSNKSQSTVKIGDHEFSRVEVARNAPSFTWGVSGSYLVAAIGEGEAQRIVEHLHGSTPDWLTEAKKSVETPRPSSFLHLDVPQLFDFACDFLSPTDVVAAIGMLRAFGLDTIQSLSYGSGLDDHGSMSRGRLKLSGELCGILTLLDCEPLTATDFRQISSTSPFAVIFQLSLDDALTAFFKSGEHEMASRDAKSTAADFHRQIAALDGVLGFKLREDLLPSIGDTWRVFVQPGSAAFVSGWTISVDLADSAKFLEMHTKLLAALRKNFDRAGGQVKIFSEEHEQTFVHSAHISGMPFVPAWCIHEDRLLIATSPATVGRLLSEPAPPVTLAEAEPIRPFLNDNFRTLKLVHVDTSAVAKFVAPFISRQLDAARRNGLVDSSLMPPVDVVARHLQPTVVALVRTDDGLEFTQHGTWPGIDFGQAASLIAVAILPAADDARNIAQRHESQNNQKQISLALHNFAASVGAFPAGYSADGQGKPLLSWRVHILPFLEGQALYDQFHLEEPWDSPHNKALIEQMPEVFRSPDSKAEAGKTTYLGVGGADGVFVRPQPDGLSGTKMIDITDGTSNTVMTIESTDDRAIIWTKPGDFAPKQDDPQQGMRIDDRRGMSLAFADGSVRNIPKKITKETLMAFFTKAGGEAIDQH